MEPSHGQFTIRSILKWTTVLAVILGAILALKKYVGDMAMRVEREAARKRVLEDGSDIQYDRDLLGAEVDSLKAERAHRLSTGSP